MPDNIFHRVTYNYIEILWICNKFQRNYYSTNAIVFIKTRISTTCMFFHLLCLCPCCEPNSNLTAHITPVATKSRSYLHICPLRVNQFQHYFSEFLCIWQLTARSEQSLWVAAGYTPSRTGLTSFYWWPAESCYLFRCLEQKCQISVILLYLLILCRMSYWFVIDVYHAYVFWHRAGVSICSENCSF